jgi:hypothetical protein
MSSLCGCCKIKDDKPTIDADIHDNETNLCDCDNWNCCTTTINNICKNEDIEDLDEKKKDKNKKVEK